MEWTDDTILRLRSLWHDGHSTAEIGRRIGVSKNAVVGKAHRLGLPSRPSPIRRDSVGGVARSQAPRRMVGPTLPPLPAASAAAATADAATSVDAAMSAPATRPPAEERCGPVAHVPAPVLRLAVAPPAPVRVVASRSRRTVPCCWPIGEPGTKSFRFCDEDALAGKPYCGQHAQVAYVKVRDRREEAA